jgi:hypothetical protein
LRDLHHGEAIYEITYIQKNSLPTLNGGLWGDFTAIFGYQNIYNFQFTFGTKIIVELY